MKLGQGPTMVSQANSQPIMGAAMAGWENPLQFIKIKDQIVDGVVVPTRTSVFFKGVVQPFSPRKLYLKPEGQRSWTWLQVHAAVSPGQKIALIPNDKIEWNGDLYKVMNQTDYSQNGYIEYEIVKDFQSEKR